MKNICVDASVTKGNPGIGEYRGMDLETNEVLFSYKFPSKVSNNIAEWSAIVNAIQYCKDNNFNNVTIYSDSKIAINWVRIKRHKSNIEKDYPHLFTIHLKEWLEGNNKYLQNNKHNSIITWWNKRKQGMEIPADYGRK